jgi:uncharacterized membrane protein
MTLVLLGALLFLLGIDPDIVGLDRSPVVGFVQVGVWLTGLAILLISSYAAVRIVRNGRPLSLRAEIGERLIATGYVIAAAASLADFIGIGSHEIPELIFGPLQVIGLVVGILIALFGLILYFPRQRRKAPKEEAASPAKDSPAGMSPTTGAG